MPNNTNQLVTTKQLPQITGLSKSFFEKGRILGYGPKFIRGRSGGRSGKVLYRLSDVERWLADQECLPKGNGHV